MAYRNGSITVDSEDPALSKSLNSIKGNLKKTVSIPYIYNMNARFSPNSDNGLEQDSYDAALQRIYTE